MKRLFILFLLLFCIGCPNYEETDPGDKGTIGWKPGEKVIGEIIDCEGASRGRLDIRQSGITVKNCIIEGDVRIWGMARNSSNENLYESSRTIEHVANVREAGPAWVIIEDSEIIGESTIPLYVSPGVNMLTVRRVKIQGESASVMVYLDAESYGTTLDDVEIDATVASREAIAIDGSNFNIFKNVSIKHNKGGIYLYRNCGEAGVSRHTTPSDNNIEATILGGGISVYLGSREGNRNYCGEDKDSSYGSGISNYDHSRRNIIKIISDGEVKEGKTAENNDIEQELP
jgi:hypothetical protein